MPFYKNSRIVSSSDGGVTPVNDDNFTVQVDADALDSWSNLNPSKLTDNMVALLINDDVGESEWLQYDTSIPDWKYLDASGFFSVDTFGNAVSLRKIELSQEFEVTSQTENPGYGYISISQFMRNISPVTTFFKAESLNRTITPGEEVDLINEFYSEFTEQLITSTGAVILDNANDPFTTFISNTPTGKVIFPDIENTTKQIIDVREVAVSCRISGSFDGGLDSAVLVDYYQLNSSGVADIKIGTMAFERQFQLDFDARAQSLVSRLSKQTSTLVQNGAKFIMSLPTGAPSNFTLNEVDFLITVGG